MRHSLTFFSTDSVEAEPNSTFDVLIAYEDFETGKQAKKTYDVLQENLGDECSLTNQMWKFDVLSIPKLHAIAVKDAVNADIIILSAHGDELPDPVVKWIESWMMQGTNAMALVALLGNDEASSLSVRNYLAEAARRAGLEFFVQPDEWPRRNLPTEPLLFRRDSVADERTLSTFSDASNRDIPVRHWGINE